jgi:hypothetical protein
VRVFVVRDEDKRRAVLSGLCDVGFRGSGELAESLTISYRYSNKGQSV